MQRACLVYISRQWVVLQVGPPYYGTMSSVALQLVVATLNHSVTSGVYTLHITPLHLHFTPHYYNFCISLARETNILSGIQRTEHRNSETLRSKLILKYFEVFVDINSYYCFRFYECTL